MRQRVPGDSSSSKSSLSNLKEKEEGQSTPVDVEKSFLDIIRSMKAAIIVYGDPEDVVGEEGKRVLGELRQLLGRIEAGEREAAIYGMAISQLKYFCKTGSKNLSGFFSMFSYANAKTRTLIDELTTLSERADSLWPILSMEMLEKFQKALLEEEGKKKKEEGSSEPSGIQSKVSEQLGRLESRVSDNDVKLKELKKGTEKSTEEMERKLAEQELRHQMEMKEKLEAERVRYQEEMKEKLGEERLQYQKEIERKLEEKEQQYKREIAEKEKHYEEQQSTAIARINEDWQVELKKQLAKTLREAAAQANEQFAELRREIEELKQNRGGHGYASSSSQGASISIINEHSEIDLTNKSEQQESVQIDQRRIAIYVPTQRLRLLDIYSRMLKSDDGLYKKYKAGIDVFLATVLCDLSNNNLPEFIANVQASNSVFKMLINDVLSRPTQKSSLAEYDQKLVGLLREWHVKKQHDDYKEIEARVMSRLQLTSDLPYAVNHTQSKIYREILGSSDICLSTEVKEALQGKLDSVKRVQPVADLTKNRRV